MSIDAIHSLGSTSANAVTGYTTKYVLSATIDQVDASINEIAKYYIATGEDIRNVRGAVVTIASMAQAANNGSFKVTDVDMVNNAIYVINPLAVAETGATGTLSSTLKIHCLYAKSLNSTTAPLNYKGTVDASNSGSLPAGPNNDGDYYQVVTTGGTKNFNGTWDAASSPEFIGATFEVNDAIIWNPAGTWDKLSNVMLASQVTYDNSISGLTATNVQDAIDEIQVEKMTNPMSSVGDMIIGDISGAPTSLAIGTNGYVLTVESGTPTWKPASGGGTVPGGNDTEVQFNDGGSFGGDPALSFNKNTNILSVDNVQFDTTPTSNTASNGLMYWDSGSETLSFDVTSGSIQIGQEEFDMYHNLEGAQLVNGDVVSICGATGNRNAICLTDATNATEALACIGMVTVPTIAIGAVGRITKSGRVRNLNTNSFTEGMPVYVDPANPGKLTQTPPVAPNFFIHVGIVSVKHATVGVIDIEIRVNPRLEDLSDVDGTPLTTTGQIPVWNQTAGYFDFNRNIDTLPIDINRNGFLNQTQTSISFNDSTYVFTLTDAGAGWSYYRSGLKYTISGNKTVTLPGTPPAAATYFIYIDATDGTLTQSTTAWTLNDTKVPVAIISWNNALTPKYLLMEERHSCLIDSRDHMYLHYTIGTRVSTVGALTGYTLDTDTNAAKTFAIAQSSIFDEDIYQILSALAEPDGTNTDYTVAYRTALTTWGWKKSNMPFIYNVGNTNDWIQWDNAGTMTDATGGAGGNTRYLNSYLLFSNAQNESARFLIIPGRAIFLTQVGAVAEDFTSFDLTGLPVSEATAVYQLTWSTVTSTSQGKCRLIATPKRINVNITQTTGAVAGTDHNSLSNLQGGTTGEYYHLTSDQHTIATQAATDSLAGYVSTTTQAFAGSKEFKASVTVSQGTVTFDGTTTVADWTTNIKKTLTMTGSITNLNFTNPASACNTILKIIQGGTGSYTVTNWDTDIKWAGGTPPTLSTAVGSIDICAFYFDGTNYFGTISKGFA